MSSTGVREANDTNKRVIKGLILNEAQFIQSLRIFANTSTLSGLGSTEGEINNSPKDPSGNYLSRLGDTMLGPLALSPPLDFTIEIDANNTIDIGPLNDNAQYTSNVQLDSIQPNSFVLDIIANAAFDGQLLFLRTFAPTTPFTISQGTLGNGGNIQTGDGNDLTVGDLQTVALIFDEALKIEANTGGSWRVYAVSSGGGGTGSLSEPIELGFNEVVTQTPPTLTIIAGDVFNPSHVNLDQDIELQLDISATTSKYKSLFVIFDTTGGGFTVTWPASVVNPPIIPDTVAQRISVILYTIDNGTLWTHATSVGSSSSGNLSDLVIDVNKDWLAQGISNFGNLTGVTGIDFDGVATTIQGLSNIDFFQASHSINSISGSMLFQVDTSDFLGFFAGGVEIAKFDDTTGLTMQGTHVINMGNNIINSISELQLSNANAHTPSNELSIAFDNNDDALKYSVALTTDVHMFFADTDLLATLSRVGTNEGLLSIQAVTATSLQATETLFLSTFNNTTPTNGEIWRDSGDGNFKFRQNGVTEELGGASGANTSLSNLTIPTSVNRDLIPDQATGGNLGSGSAGEEWFNLFSRRVTFPVATSLGAGDYTFGRVASPDRVQYNVPTGAVHRWTINGTNEMELSNVELILNGVNLDMENNSITDANQIQITGSSGDTVRGFLTGAAGVFDITADENSGLMRLFARTSGGILNQLLTIDGDDQSTTVGFGVAALLKFGLTGNVPTISRISDDLQINTNNALELQIAASPVMTITSTDINVFQDLDMDNNVTVDWATTQSTVGAAGAADVIPNRPSSYIIIKVNGTEFVIPAFAIS